MSGTRFNRKKTSTSKSLNKTLNVLSEFARFSVNDLVKENGQFLSQNEFENRYNTKTNFIQFQGIIHAIKDYARKHGIINFTKNLKMPFIPINIFLLIKSKKGGKDFYNILNNNNDKPTSQPKWENTYNIEQDIEHGKIYMYHLLTYQ